MLRRTIATVFMAVIAVAHFLFPMPVNASHSVWLSYQEGAERAERVRDFARAKELYLAAMREAASDHDGQSKVAFAQSANAVASLLIHEGDYTQAEDVLDNVLSLRKTEHELASNEAIAANMLLAEAFFRHGKLDEAEKALRVALTHMDNIRQDDHPSAALALNNLANIKAARKQMDEAEAIVRRAITIAEQPGGDRSHLAASLDTLADILHSRGKTAEAAALAQRALVEAECLLGDEHLLTAGIHETLGRVSDSLGQKKEAEQHFRKQVAVARKHYRADHPLLVQPMDNLRAFLDRDSTAGTAASKPEKSTSIGGFISEPVTKRDD